MFPPKATGKDGSINTHKWEEQNEGKYVNVRYAEQHRTIPPNDISRGNLRPYLSDHCPKMSDNMDGKTDSSDTLKIVT